MWFDMEAPEESPIPDGYNSLDTFRKLLLVRLEKIRNQLRILHTTAKQNC